MGIIGALITGTFWNGFTAGLCPKVPMLQGGTLSQLVQDTRKVFKAAMRESLSDELRFELKKQRFNVERLCFSLKKYSVVNSASHVVSKSLSTAGKIVSATSKLVRSAGKITGGFCRIGPLGVMADKYPMVACCTALAAMIIILTPVHANREGEGGNDEGEGGNDEGEGDNAVDAPS